MTSQTSCRCQTKTDESKCIYFYLIISLLAGVHCCSTQVIDHSLNSFPEQKFSFSNSFVTVTGHSRPVKIFLTLKQGIWGSILCNSTFKETQSELFLSSPKPKAQGRNVSNNPSFSNSPTYLWVFLKKNNLYISV